MTGHVRDAETRADVPMAIHPRRNPGAQRDAGTTATEQSEETERCRLLVIIADPRYQIDPSISYAGELRHPCDDLRVLVDAERHSLDLS